MVAPWRIVERIQGYVDSRIPDQDVWSPIFRSRRLSDGGMVRVQTLGVARLNMADGSSFTFTALWNPIIFSISDYQLSIEGAWKVFDLRQARVMHDVGAALGVQQFRVDPADAVNRAHGGTLGARG